LKQKDFFENVGAITLFAMFGTMISTFVVGGLAFYAARLGIIPDVDHENPMEALMFGALISSVDPVATLSIMGNAELKCDPLLYSLVFGESVLNDAVAISLFRVFEKYYNPEGPSLSEAEIPSALASFVYISAFSVASGVAFGLLASFLYKNTSLHDYPHLEMSILCCFCYVCYAANEAMGISGIMALFFQGMVLAHYNSYNLSPTAHIASEQIFSTLATLSETMVFLYMGMDCFTGRFGKTDMLFSVMALGFCIVGRFLNIFPLAGLANMCRESYYMHDASGRSNKSADGNRRITSQMQFVLWFVGLRGAIAFALAMKMPGPNREIYATATLFICIFTTVFCGGLTESVLTFFQMKLIDDEEDEEDELQLNSLTSSSFHPKTSTQTGHSRFPLAIRTKQHVYKGAKRLWKQFDDDILKPNFGGSNQVEASHPLRHGDSLGNYELGFRNGSSHYDDGSDFEDGNLQENHCG